MAIDILDGLDGLDTLDAVDTPFNTNNTNASTLVASGYLEFLARLAPVSDRRPTDCDRDLAIRDSSFISISISPM